LILQLRDSGLQRLDRGRVISDSPVVEAADLISAAVSGTVRGAG
jgi:hypothetical protein